MESSLCVYFTSVYEGVFLHVRFLVEPLPAEGTRVRSRVRVNEQVCGQSRRPLEHLPTNLTAKTPLLKHKHTAYILPLYSFMQYTVYIFCMNDIWMT